ncbi:hypothetical protein [Pararhizobium sp.]|uniref:hypothetical protein n=1 Tax=Pararhizobium sp. TaxID=1977563 RepID=UPI00271766E5|nr:hypothetical protein [Pararhizobium sp.]MDO9418224.1 hypothetical protein [Pararhizobium sp.]
MNESQLATEIATKVVSDTKFWIALIGLAGAVIGSLLTIGGNLLLHWLSEKPQNDLDKNRIAMLKTMLDDDRFPEKWRKLSTLSAVIGANEENTKGYFLKLELEAQKKLMANGV